MIVVRLDHERVDADMTFLERDPFSGQFIICLENDRNTVADRMESVS